MEEEILKSWFNNWVQIIDEDPQKFLDNFNWCNIITTDDDWINFACEKITISGKYYVNIKYYENKEEIVIKEDDVKVYRYCEQFGKKQIISDVITSIADFVVPVFKENKIKKREAELEREKQERLKKLSEIKEKLLF
jgi:hypothetical protein